MTTTTSDVAPEDAPPPEPDAQPEPAPRTGRTPEEAEKSRFWRTVWRVHFYAGVLVLPVLAMLALTGMTILFDDNILDRTDGSLRLVIPTGTARSMDEQVAAAAAALPGRPLQKGLIILAVVLGVIFPLAGLTMIAVVLLDRYVIRKVPTLRHTFGMR